MLPGGAPRADYAKMGKAELMAAAKDLGVRTHNGRNYRRVDEVRADCEVKLAQRASTLDVPSSSQEVSEFDGLRRDDLRARAKGLGVTTHVGYKWRATVELRRACVEKTKAPQALAEAESHGTLGAYFRQPQVA